MYDKFILIVDDEQELLTLAKLLVVKCGKGMKLPS